jgi:hypothetical protein
MSIKPPVYQGIHIVDAVIGRKFEIDTSGDDALFPTFKCFEKCLIILYLIGVSMTCWCTPQGLWIFAHQLVSTNG